MANTLNQLRLLVRRNREGILIGALAGLSTGIILQQVAPEAFLQAVQTQSFIDPAVQFVTGAAVGTVQIATHKITIVLTLVGAIIGGIIDHVWKPLA